MAITQPQTTQPPVSTASAVPPGSPQKTDPNNRYYFVSFTTDPTPGDPSTGSGNYWLFDNISKNYYPFASAGDAGSFASRHNITLDDAHTVKMTPEVFQISTDYHGGQFLPLNYSPKADGTIPEYHTGLQTYGQQNSPLDTQVAILKTGQFFGRMLDSGHISKDTWDLLRAPDGRYVAKFAQAGLYGGYTLGDMWRQAKIDELAKTNPRYAGMKAIDPTMSADQFYKTAAYRDSQQDPNLVIPTALYADAINKGSDPRMGGLLLNTPLYQISTALFKELTPTLDWNDPAMRAEADKIHAAYYDLLQMQTNADTAQAKQLADTKWEEFRSKMKKDYNITLDKNARTAWGQLQQITQNFASRGLSNTGLEDEAKSNYLRDVRLADAQNRAENTTVSLQQEVQNLRANGTAEEIQAFIDKNGIDVAKKQGLIPSDETRKFFSVDNLKAQFPNYSPAEIQALHDTYLDKNGNYTSDLFKKQAQSTLGNTQNKIDYQQNKLQSDRQQQAEEKYRPFTQTAFHDYSEAPQKPDLPTGINDKLPGVPSSADTSVLPGAKDFQMPSGYEKINGAQYKTTADQQGAYSDIKTFGTLGTPGSYLYGKKKITP